MIHMAITRDVKPGQEDEFERRIQTFFRETENFPGTHGAYLLRPMDANSRQYGIMRSFEHEDAREAFYNSKPFKDWDNAIQDLVEGKAERRELHGLEAFFRSTHNPEAEVPAWKMAVVTWLGVNPAVYIFANLVPWAFGTKPGILELVIVNTLVVVCLTWFFMPLLTRVFQPFLQPSQGAS